MKNQVLIIIPAYNEEKSIENVLKDLENSEIISFADILVMNDASSDNTNWIVKGRNHTLVTHVFNLGYGSAIQLGYKYAIRKKYKYIIQMDADGQHDTKNILKIYNKLKEKDSTGQCPDIVIGSRYISKDISDFKTPFLKKVAFVYFRNLIKLTTGKKITDPTSGLQGLSRRAAISYSKYGNFDTNYPDTNMIISMQLAGYKIEEIPAIMHNRNDGESMHSGLKPIWYMIYMTLSIIVILIRNKILKNGPKIEDDLI